MDKRLEIFHKSCCLLIGSVGSCLPLCRRTVHVSSPLRFLPPHLPPGPQPRPCLPYHLPLVPRLPPYTCTHQLTMTPGHQLSQPAPYCQATYFFFDLFFQLTSYRQSWPILPWHFNMKVPTRLPLRSRLRWPPVVPNCHCSSLHCLLVFR